jgi:hypothetical protein
MVTGRTPLLPKLVSPRTRTLVGVIGFSMPPCTENSPP